MNAIIMQDYGSNSDSRYLNTIYECPLLALKINLSSRGLCDMLHIPVRSENYLATVSPLNISSLALAISACCLLAISMPLSL